jgi:outer membrane protein OmpA-like peptidoglycan-associated protein
VSGTLSRELRLRTQDRPLSNPYGRLGVTIMEILASMALTCCMLTAINGAEPVPLIPLRVGLTIVTAISDKQGDYESIKRFESEDAVSLRLRYSSERPKPIDLLGDNDDGKPRPTVAFSVYRRILRQDLLDSHNYLQQFSPPPLVPETFPGASAIGVSTAVLNDLKTKSQSFLIVYQTILPAFPLKVDRQPGELDYRLSGVIARVEPNAVPVPVIVNGKLTNLPAIHARGLLTIEQSEFYFLDDPKNPLALRFKIGRDTLTLIKINFPGDTEFANTKMARPPDSSSRMVNTGEKIEQSLATAGRAAVYGIYFTFGSAKIRDESEPVLKEIADTMKKHPSWILNVEGHTDNIGGNASNQDLSNRRAAAVRLALVERYQILPGRLAPVGFGASRPKGTNETLEGRALNRRVELVKQ